MFITIGVGNALVTIVHLTLTLESVAGRKNDRTRNVWNLLDFTDTVANMYGVLDCCSHKSTIFGSRSVTRAFYDYNHAPKSNDPRLSLHMSYDLCLGESNPPETEPFDVAGTMSMCRIGNPARRLMIPDNANRQGAFETYLLQTLAVAARRPVYGMSASVHWMPLVQSYITSTAYRHKQYSTIYCYPRARSTNVLYSPVFVRESLRGVGFKCNTTHPVCDYEWFDGAGYKAVVKWPFGVAETPNFSINNLYCKHVPAQTVNSIIHMYPILSFTAMSNTGRFQEAHIITRRTCRKNVNCRHTGLCFYSDIYNDIHEMEPSILASACPAFQCLRSFYDGDTSYAYPKCVSDLPPMHKTFGAYRLTLKSYRADVQDTGGFYTERPTRDTTSCLMAVPIGDALETAKMQVIKYVAYCDTITLDMPDLTHLRDTIKALNVFSLVTSSLGVMIPDTLLGVSPKVFSSIKQQLVNRAVLTHFTINVVSSPTLCILHYLMRPYISHTSHIIKTMFPGTLVTVRAPGSMFYNLPSISEFSADLTQRTLDRYVAGIDFIVLVMARLRTYIPFRDYGGQEAMTLTPQCPSQWVSKTKSHWLWSSESVVGPHVREPELAYGVRPDLYGVVTVPNAMTLFGPDRIVVELDTGCTQVSSKGFSHNNVTKCNKATVQTAPCSPLFGSDCCAVNQLNDSFTFVQSASQLQQLVSDLMTWDIRHLNYGYLEDVDVVDNNVPMLDLLHNVVTPKPVMFLYSTDRSGPPEYCPGVVKATRFFIFQKTEFYYNGFFRLPASDLTVGLSNDKSLCRMRVVDTMQPQVIASNTHPVNMTDAYYVDTLLLVERTTERFKPFVFYANGTVFLHSPQLLKAVTDTYTMKHMVRAIPTGKFARNPMVLSKIVATEPETYVTTGIRPKTLGQTPILYKHLLTVKPIDVRTKYKNLTTLPGVNEVIRASRKAEFLGIWTAGNSLFDMMGLSYPQYTETSYSMSGSRLVLVWDVEPVALPAARIVKDNLLAHVTNSMSFLNSIGRIEAHRWTHDNLYACLLGSGLGCWLMTEDTLNTALGPGQAVSWTRADTSFRLAVRNYQAAEWMIEFDYMIPMASNTKDCFSTKPIRAAVYPHLTTPCISDDPLSISEEYMCGNCVKNVCVHEKDWVVRLPFVEDKVRSVHATRLQRDIYLAEMKTSIDECRHDLLDKTYITKDLHRVNLTIVTRYVDQLTTSRTLKEGGISDILNNAVIKVTNRMRINICVLAIDVLSLVLAIALTIVLCILIVYGI